MAYHIPYAYNIVKKSPHPPPEGAPHLDGCWPTRWHFLYLAQHKKRMEYVFVSKISLKSFKTLFLSKRRLDSWILEHGQACTTLHTLWNIDNVSLCRCTSRSESSIDLSTTQTWILDYKDNNRPFFQSKRDKFFMIHLFFSLLMINYVKYFLWTGKTEFEHL